MKGLILIILFLFFSIEPYPLFAQKVGEEEKLEREIEKERILRERIEKEKKLPEVEEKKPEVAPLPIKEEKIFIKKIDVIGVTLLPQKEIEEIIAPFENKELTLRDFQRVADLITDRYRQKGYITSRAYLPPQKIEQGILEVRVIEGVTGDTEIKGNRYFKTQLFERKLTLKKDEPFNYNILRKNLARINEHPDRASRAVLIPGKKPGSTDIVLEVKDRLPIHIGFDFDNFGSRYIGKDRYKTTLTHNNLSGWEDILTIQYQLAQSNTYRLNSLRYLLPLNESLDLGFFTARTKLDLGKEFKDLDARGKSRLYSIYLTQSLIEEESIDLSLNVGFDHKDIFNFQLGNETSRDRLRVARAGLDLDLTDKFGRTIITNEIDFGIPDIMGGLQEQDSKASRSGSGGKFIKDTLNLFRVQKMPFDSALLWKNQLQLSPYILSAAEQFQIGGIVNVRGYPPAEHVGDKGFTTTLEWSMPFYPLSKEIKIPVSGARLYDALKFTIFYDWANVDLRRPQAGEEKKETLSSAGYGIRFNLPQDFSLRLDFAWPLDKTPSDGDHLHTWVQASKTF